MNSKEYQAGTNIVTIDQNRIVHVRVIGEQTDENAEAHLQFHEQAYNIAGGKIRYLININQTGKSSPKARRTWKELGDMPNTEKVAVYGSHAVARVTANLVLRTFTRNETRFFIDEESARTWLMDSAK